MFYVLNLKRRKDRLRRFVERFDQTGLSYDDLIVCDAVDGIDVLHPFEYVHLNNDFAQNPRISATIESHFRIWERIVQSNTYGVIFEDDIHFHPQFKEKWTFIQRKLKSRKNFVEIMYLGLGDTLPCLNPTIPPRLLKSLDRSHVKKNSYQQKAFGIPNDACPYVFKWFGAFAYLLNVKTAKYLIYLTKTYKIDCAIDVWLKKRSISKFSTVPLLAYHDPLHSENYDSDTQGIITLPVDTTKRMTNDMKFAFLIPCTGKTDSSQLEKCVSNILHTTSNCENVLIAVFLTSYEDKSVHAVLSKYRKTCSIATITGNEQTPLHSQYNYLWKTYFKAADFFFLWNIHLTIHTSQWDAVVCEYHHHYNKPSICAFQTSVLYAKDTSVCYDMKHIVAPILSKKVLSILDTVSPFVNVLQYIKYVIHLSKITIFTREIVLHSRKEVSFFEEIMEEKCIEDKLLRSAIDKSITKLKRNVDYRPCGVWMKYPENWTTRKILHKDTLKSDLITNEKKSKRDVQNGQSTETRLPQEHSPVSSTESGMVCTEEE